ncbi:MAG: hypothetical protein PHC85_00960 [Candidatus Pacebacteria bacterium]|nr:hypothetical protein [Candidatus Paceibacterota bacterium]
MEFFVADADRKKLKEKEKEVKKKAEELEKVFKEQSSRKEKLRVLMDLIEAANVYDFLVDMLIADNCLVKDGMEAARKYLPEVIVNFGKDDESADLGVGKTFYILVTLGDKEILRI